MHTEEPQITELRQLATQARDYQIERGWSDGEMLRQIPQLGSTKTYKRILDATDPLDGLSVENQLTALTEALAMISIRRKSDKFAEPEYEDFANVVDSLAAIRLALDEESKARFVAIQGENGTGKDAVKNALLARWGKITLSTEANEFWRDSLAAPVNDIMGELNRVRKSNLTPKQFPLQNLELLIHTIGDQSLILLINEAHHLGPRGLNLVKTLINRCDRLVVVAEFIPALLRRLQASAYEECSQLFGNRLCKRVKLTTPQPDEIMLMLKRRKVEIESPRTMKAVLDELSNESKLNGNWRYVIQFTREARAIAAGKPLSLEQFVAAKSRVGERRMGANQMRAA